ncbi:unnamed protein product, partial [Symbiodinium sp. CCMP2456]
AAAAVGAVDVAAVRVGLVEPVEDPVVAAVVGVGRVLVAVAAAVAVAVAVARVGPVEGVACKCRARWDSSAKWASPRWARQARPKWARWARWA